MTDEQRAAAYNYGDRNTIVAGPGTGKTFTLIQRIRYLTHYCQVRRIIALTFTVAAARELEERAAGVVPSGAVLTCTTLHAWALELLELVPGMEGRTVYDETDATDIRTMVRLTTPGKAVPKVYRQRMREAHGTDYDMLMTDLLDALHRGQIPPDLLPPHLMVDEYQDLDATQHAIIDALADHGVHVTTVGDPRQSIYRWRGARPDLMRRYATPMNLTTSFRSSPEIVEHANAIYGDDRYLHWHPIRSSRDSGPAVATGPEASPYDVERFEHQTRGMTRAILCRTWRDCGDAYDVLGPDRAVWYGAGPRPSEDDKALSRWIRLAANPHDHLLKGLLILYLHGEEKLREALMGRMQHTDDLLPPIPRTTVTAEVAAAFPRPISADRMERLSRPYLRSTKAFARWWAFGRSDRPTMDAADHRVHVMSVHQAKGLEWDAVMAVVPPPGDEEDRSIQYVAHTRASRILWAFDRGRMFQAKEEPW